MEARKIELFVPSLTELCEVLQKSLSSHYKNVHVSVQECPDLTAAPFGLSHAGLGGHPGIVSAGSLKNLLPVQQLDKYYSFDDLVRAVNRPNSQFIGAGAGPHRQLKHNSELIVHFTTKDGHIHDSSQVAYLNKDESCCLTTSPSPHVSILADLFVCDGQPGPVIKIEASESLEKTANFHSACRQALTHHYGDMPVALGGVFVLTSGEGKVHVMREFSQQPITNNDELKNWLRFFNVPPPIIALGFVFSHDPGLDLRLEHFHCYGSNAHGGHYDNEATPESAKYEAYFSVAQTLYRVD